MMAKPNPQVVREKRSLATKLLRQGKNNEQIVKAVKLKFKTGISTNDLATIRRAVNGSKPNLSREEMVEARKQYAIELFRGGSGNEEVSKAVKKRFGKGMAKATLSQIRRDIGLYRKKQNGKKKTNGRLTETDVLVLQGNDATTELKVAITTVVNRMKLEGIEELTIDGDGNVSAKKLQELNFVVGGLS